MAAHPRLRWRGVLRQPVAAGAALTAVLAVGAGLAGEAQVGVPGPASYCRESPRFSLTVPAGWRVGPDRRQATADGEFDVVRWDRGTRAFIMLNLHAASRDEPLAQWARDLGGELAPTTLVGGVPAFRRTALFEAVYERSVFFRVSDDPRVVELRLVVPGIQDWMSPSARTELQVRPHRLDFDRVVSSLKPGACP